MGELMPSPDVFAGELYNHIASVHGKPLKSHSVPCACLKNLVARLSIEETRLGFRTSSSSTFAVKRDKSSKGNRQKRYKEGKLLSMQEGIGAFVSEVLLSSDGSFNQDSWLMDSRATD